MDNDNVITSYRNEKGQFVKNYKHQDLPLEIREKKRLSNIKSWKNRPDYIANLINENPYIYNSWRGILFTKKGKKIGCCDKWRNFKNFYNDVSPTYKKGLLFRRKNYNAPFSEENFVWCTKEEASSMLRNSIVLQYNGELLTLKELAEKYNQSYYAIKGRYHKRNKKNYTIEDIIFGKQKNRFSKVVKDYRDVNVNIRAKASKMISSYKAKDAKNGINVCDIDIDWMIDNILTQNCAYCGDNNRVGCDRINNNLGHTKNNVVPCCIECNVARNNYFTFDEMKILGQTIKMIKQSRSNK